MAGKKKVVSLFWRLFVSNDLLNFKTNFEKRKFESLPERWLATLSKIKRKEKQQLLLLLHGISNKSKLSNSITIQMVPSTIHKWLSYALDSSL